MGRSGFSASSPWGGGPMPSPGLPPPAPRTSNTRAPKRSTRTTGSAWRIGSLSTQEHLLGRIRAREDAQQAKLARIDPAAAKEYRQARDRIAACTRDGAAELQAYFFLESSHAFDSHLFGYARALLRLADESAKPPADRLPEYDQAGCEDIQRGLLEHWTIVRELDICKLAESLDLWVRYAGADAGLAAKVLDGKTPLERARALVEGSRLDQRKVRKALLHGGRDAVAKSQDAMLVLARLVDARSRAIRQQVREQISEPCCEAYAVLTRIQRQSLGGAGYPDATGTLRLSFGKLQPYSTSLAVVRLADVYGYGNRVPKDWQAARGRLDTAAPIIFRCSADIASGNSGSPVVNRRGELLGMATRGNSGDRLAYDEVHSGCYTIAAHGMLEVLDHVYHAAELAKELGRHVTASGIVAAGAYAVPTLTVPQPLPPAVVAAARRGSLFRPASPVSPAAPAAASPAGSLRALAVPPSLPAPVVAPTPPVSAPTRPAFLVNPFPSADALLSPAKHAAPAAPAIGKRPEDKRPADRVPALIKALKDRDAAVRQAAATALRDLGRDAVPALIEALQAQDMRHPADAAPVHPEASGTK